MKIIIASDPKEKRLVWIAMTFFILAIAAIGLGIYNQSQGINQDRLLVPLVLLLFSAMFLTFSYAAFKQYKIITESSIFIFPFLLTVVENITSFSENKYNQRTFRILGIILIMIALSFIGIAIFSLTKL